MTPCMVATLRCLVPHAQKTFRHFRATPRHRHADCAHLPFLRATPSIISIQRQRAEELVNDDVKLNRFTVPWFHIFVFDVFTDEFGEINRQSPLPFLDDATWVAVARVVSPPLAIKAYCRFQYVRIESKRGS
jgi:hypothetical protein